MGNRIIKKLGLIVILLVLSISMVSAWNFDFFENKDVIGVNLDEDYYTVVIKNGKITKIEIDGTEQTDYTVNTTKEELSQVIKDMVGQNKFEKIRFIMDKTGLPSTLLLRVGLRFYK